MRPDAVGIQHVQTKREIEALLGSRGLRPRKRLGQHFLIDGNLMRRLASRAELEPGDMVVEVGPGTGGLTDLILPQVSQVVCVEIDRDLVGLLEDRFREKSEVTILEGDVLEGKHRIMPALEAAIRGFESPSGGCVKLVANLPYQVASPLMMNLLLDYPEVRRLCFTVQAEVGERITSTPNCKSYGPLSILTQLLCEIEVVAKVPASAFWPVPAVASVMLRMDVSEPPFADRDELRRFAALVRGTFDHRRKTLRTALGYVIDPAKRDAICDHVDGTRRPESFTIQEWVDIHRAAEEA